MNGTITIENGDSLSYTPDLGFNGIDTVIYQICDNGVPTLCDVDTVFITVNPVNDPPVALDDYSTTDPTVEDTIAVLTNDIDPEGGPIAVAVITQPPNGTATVLVDGTIEYVTNGIFVNGVDSFTYVICDNGIPSLCDTAQVYIVVPLSSLPPVAVDDYTIVNEDDSVVIDVTFNDIDPNIPGDTLVVNIFSGPDNGTATISGDTIIYTPGPNFNGVDSIVYVICDTANFCDSGTVYITVLPFNDAPDAITDNASTNENTPVIIDVQNNDTDLDGDGLITSVVVTSSNGTVVIFGNDSLSYTPNPSFNGLDTIIYQICDNGVPTMCDIDTVFVTVIPINEAPVIVDGDTILITTPEDTPITICIAATDIDGDNLDITTSFNGPADGLISGLNDGDTCFVYTPDPDYFGGDTVTVEVCDGLGGCDTIVVVITITPINDAPIIVDTAGNPADTITFTTPLGVPITICLDGIDIEVDSLEVTSTLNGPTNGMITGTANGDTCFVYTPNPGYVGGDTVSVVVCDNNAGCDTVIVIINVTPLPPIAVDDFAATNTGVIGITILDNDTDPQGSILTYFILTEPSNGTAVNDPQGIIYTPEDDYCGIDNIQYQICNEYGLCDNAWVYITVIPTDSDGDGIPDYVETTSADTDGDGELDYLSLDSDGDGISDSQEAGMFIGDPCIFDPIPDCNADGIPDYQDAESCEIVSFEIPEGFSPNGDNVNDYFEIKGLEEYPDNSIIIFNRWGNKVFAAEPYDNNWGGTNSFGVSFGGEDLPEGTYFYLLKLTTDDEPIKGYVYITR